MPVMVATTIETLNGWTRMVYHKTCVAEYNPTERKVKLNSGGYQTVTTKKRINQFFRMFALPFSLYQEKGDWIVRQKTADNAGVPVHFLIDFSDNLELTY